MKKLILCLCFVLNAIIALSQTSLNNPLVDKLNSIYYDDSNDRILEEEEVKKYGF